MDDLISRQAALDWLKNEWNGMVTSLFDGIKALPSAQQRPPKKTGYYICTCHDGICYRTSVLKWSTGWVLTGARSHWKVIAWMPLPEPYKGEES